MPCLVFSGPKSILLNRNDNNNILIDDYIFLFEKFQRGHIYTSSGSFFIEPIEEYTIDNQNILHKISREKLLDEKLHSDKIQNGKVLIDDISSHDFISVESVSNSITAFDTGDDVQLNVNRFNEPEFDISGNISCSTEDGKSK